MELVRFVKTSVIGIVLLIWGAFIVGVTHRWGGSADLAHFTQVGFGIFFSFHLNSKYTWPDRGGHSQRSAVLFSVGKFALLGYQAVLFPASFVVYPAIIIAVALLSESLGLWFLTHFSEKPVASLFATGVTMVLGYFYNHFIVFPNRKL